MGPSTISYLCDFPFLQSLTKSSHSSGMIFVTSCEFITGIIVNKWLNLGIWDYSNVPFQLFGQICLPFMALFGLLCTIGIYLGGYLLHVLYGEEKPKIPIW